MDFKIFYYKDALNDLENIKKRLPSDCELIINKIENILGINPFPKGSTVKKIKNVSPPLYRLRVNGIISYRIFYRIAGDAVYILKVIPKKDADKVLKKYF